jgi:hypothetical protein
MKKLIGIAVIAAGLAGAGTAHANDRTVARLVGVSGNVLVSNDFNIASAGEALRLAPGMRVLVTLNSAAIVEYDDGCRVSLGAGERIEVRRERACAVRAMPAGLAYAPVLGKRP